MFKDEVRTPVHMDVVHGVEQTPPSVRRYEDELLFCNEIHLQAGPHLWRIYEGYIDDA